MKLPLIDRLRTVAAFGVFVSLPSPIWAHQHLAAGAVTPEPDAALLFVNAANFAAESGYVFGLAAATNGPYAGYYYAEITFVCLAATLDFGGPVPFHPALGAHIEGALESVEGPAGGSIGFWESPGDEQVATELTFSVPVGETQGTQHFPVSENDGSPGADPYGHVHGRVISATQPGLYRVGFRFLDTSTNGLDGRPLHVPSPRFELLFQAGVTLDGIAPSEAGLDVSFATLTGFNYFLEGAPNLTASTVWTTLGEAIPGDSRLHHVPVESTADLRFYRLRREPL